MAKIVPKAVIAFEDARHEASGAVSLMGVIPSGNLCHAGRGPFVHRMGFGVIADIVEPGTVVLRPSLVLDGEKKWELEMEVEMLEPGNGVLILCGKTNAKFHNPGKMDFILKIGDVEHKLQSWDIVFFDKGSEPEALKQVRMIDPGLSSTKPPGRTRKAPTQLK